ncbi:protein NRT1/ PTR FAMILY 5.4-like [Prosopis cineraria]|uniref:protein NRT1/ PTR FAMILY 5.4-like n=1 Tax=Prosopis cineraria TaxID=364024 RepID=UPI00240FDEB6|nr:protein NRT1/ PTR FAMILY 5.4-like [Prosopis cineraria]XP_054817037.1 protein NRT1/ PTR FAMILY 5.4-like [Prosopis cineraria]
MNSNKSPVKVNCSSDDNKPSKGGWNSAIFIIFVEMAERLAYYGLVGNLISYLTNVLKEPIVTAAQNVNIWGGVSFVFPLVGAFIADSYLGRFMTIIFASIIYLSGTVLLTISASSLIPVHSRRLMLYLALYVLSIGEGGHKPCIQTFAADQFDDSSPEERIAKTSFFNWWFLGIVIGALVAAVGVTYVQDNIGWDVGFGIAAVAMAVAFGIFLLGIRRYKKQGPMGSPFTTMAQVVVAAVRKRHVDETRHGRGICYGDTASGDILMEPQSLTHVRTEHLSYLDKAMVIDDTDASSNRRNPWRLCTLNQVEEMKLVFGLIPIWITCLYNSIIGSQVGTFFTKQGSTMNRSIGPHFNIPPASLLAFPNLATIIIIPIYDRFLVPPIRKFTGKPTGITILQRIGIGLFISILNILVAALVEAKRLKVVRDHNLLDDSEAIVPIRVWWLLPQYIICGVADVFGIIGLQHLFYDQMPESMRSIGAAFYLGNFGIGSFVSSGIISIVEKASRGRWLGNNLNSSRLDYYYYLLAGLGVLNLGAYVAAAKRYVYQKASENCNL